MTIPLLDRLGSSVTITHGNCSGCKLRTDCLTFPHLSIRVCASCLKELLAAVKLRTLERERGY